MKVTVEDHDKPSFKPITLTLEITSRAELAALWHRLDVGGKYLVKRYCGQSEPKVKFPVEWNDDGPNAKDCTEELFKAVDGLAMKRGLRGGGQIGH